MPTDHDLRKKTAVLRRAQKALIARFGRFERPGGQQRDPIWTLVQGVIGVRTKSEISNATTDALLDKYGSWTAVAKAPEKELAAALRPQTYPNQSARRLKKCLNAIVEERGEVDIRHLSNLSDDEALAWLDTLPGVGRKVAAGVLNTSTFARKVLVIDTHHVRIVRRMGLVPENATVNRAYNLLMPAIPEQWSADDLDVHHMLMKELGREYCRPKEPLCQGCPLQPDCETGKSRASDR